MNRHVVAAGSLLVVVLASPSSSRAAMCDSNVIIVLDRSCSMDSTPNGQNATKWESAEAAIGILTTTYADQLRFGLIMFPDESGDRCVQDGPLYVETDVDTGQAVRDAIALTDPDGPCVTNIDTAMGQVSSDPVFNAVPDPSGRRSFVLLITDGKQSGACGGNTNDPFTIANIEALYADGYPTYVVGFGGGVDPDDLNDFAGAGGVPRVGDPMYYQADNAVELEEALDAIAGDIVGDPEFGGCAGTPCPDDRCFGSFEMCVDGACLTFLPDAGPQPDAAQSDGDGGNGDGGGGNADGDATGGCACRSGGASTGGSAVLLLVVFALLRRRRELRH